MSKKNTLFLTLLAGWIIALPQMTSGQVIHAYDALRLSKQMPGQDPHTMALGSSSVSQLQGFGSYLANPAVVAKMPHSSVSIGLGMRDISQRSTFPGTGSLHLNDREKPDFSPKFDDNQSGITHFGFAYKIPTVSGSLVIGAGYIQTADYNSAFGVDYLNLETSRSFQFLTDYTFDLAYSTFALDSLTINDETVMGSVFEFGGFRGVDQYAEFTRRGRSGEYNLFISTEFQKNLFFGLSAGIPVSKSKTEQFFIERSPLDQDGQPLYTGRDGTFNIDRMLFEEKINVDAIGWNARAGFLFSGLPFIDFGMSYASPTRWNVEEEFDTFIQTRFWDNVTLDGEVLKDEENEPYGTTFNNQIKGQYSYKVTTPSRWNFGASLKNLPFISPSFSAERINYSKIELSGFDAKERETQIIENRFIKNYFRDVWNYRAGVSLDIFDAFEPRFGWALMSNPIDYIEDNRRHFLSAGIGVGLNQDFSLDFAVQYGSWNTTEDIYYIHADTGIIIDDQTQKGTTFYETADQKVDRFHISIGGQIRF